MVDDFLTEQEQWEQVKLWLKENGLWIIAGIAIGILALAGWRWWQGHTQQQALAAGAQYTQILQTFNQGQRDQGMSLIDELAHDYPSSPYVAQAQLAAARVFVESGDLDQAAQRLQTVMSSAKDHELSLIARVRLARVQIAQGKSDQALATLRGAQPGTFAARYDEVRGDAYYAKGDKPAALREYQAARVLATAAGIDTHLLDLKINDLAGAAPQHTPAAAAAGK